MNEQVSDRFRQLRLEFQSVWSCEVTLVSWILQGEGKIVR